MSLLSSLCCVQAGTPWYIWVALVLAVVAVLAVVFIPTTPHPSTADTSASSSSPSQSASSTVTHLDLVAPRASVNDDSSRSITIGSNSDSATGTSARSSGAEEKSGAPGTVAPTPTTPQEWEARGAAWRQVLADTTIAAATLDAGI